MSEETYFVRLEYNSKNLAAPWHIADLGDKLVGFGWVVIMEKIPFEQAADFITYANENLITDENYYTWRMMQNELHKWLST